MRRTFTDLHVYADLRSADTAKFLSKAAELGYTLVAVSLPPTQLTQQVEALRKLASTFNLDAAVRVDLKPRSTGELTQSLRRLRRKCEVIAVTCESKEVARQAAKDRRVDLLNFQSFDSRRRFFDHAEAELARQGLAALEVDVAHLLMVSGSARVRLLACLRREVQLAKAFNVPIILSSGAPNPRLLRKPREMAALASLFSLGEMEALDAVSTNPAGIVKRNREKLSPEFVAPGIRLIKEGKDC